MVIKMPRQLGVQMTKNVAKAEERIEDLSKEELLEFIKCLRENWMRDWKRIPAIIRFAKAKIMRKKAEAAFAQWEEISKLCQQMPKETLEQQLAWFQKHNEGNQFYKKWERLWEREDETEFGPRKKESANAAK